MPFVLALSRKLKNAGWKVKIFDKEELEPPHVTILRGPDKWRLNLRDCRFLVPPGGSWKDFPKELQKVLKDSVPTFRAQWNKMHPTNPIGGQNE